MYPVKAAAVHQQNQPKEKERFIAESVAAETGVLPFASDSSVGIPDYLRDVYHWAYLSSLGRAVFDHPLVVHAILWGNMHRLTRAMVTEVKPGQSVLQPACVYGNFSLVLAKAIGTVGRLVVTDIAPLQVTNARRKLGHLSHVTVQLSDAARPPGGPYDVVACFFLLHEVPEDYKHRIVDALLSVVTPGGKVVFIDYHQPWPLHPLKPLMSLVFNTLEPFAGALWQREINSYGFLTKHFSWHKETFFGGLYQKVVAQPRAEDGCCSAHGRQIADSAYSSMGDSGYWS